MGLQLLSSRIGTSALIRRILLLVLISSMIIGSGSFYLVLRARAIATASRDARLLLTTASGVTAFTDEEVFHLADVLPRDVFYKEIVPFYTVKAVFRRLRDSYPDYIFREPALNPTNPHDRPTPHEVELTERFRDNPALKELEGIRQEGDTTFFYVAQPTRVDHQECLACHSTPDRAPAAMVAEYGASNGFGWTMGDTIGIIELSVPITAALRGTAELAVTLAASLLLIFMITYFALTTALGTALVIPLRRLAEAANTASRSTDERIELPTSGTRELRELSAAIARLNLSLRKALRQISGRMEPPAPGNEEDT